MIRDNSFLRLKNNFEDAKNLEESKAITHEYVGQVHLIPNETYLQISSSQTSIIFNGNYEVYLVDLCGNELIDVTDYMFIEEFTDTNGIKQIVWEFVNQFEYYGQGLMLRFKNTVNNDTWWTNPFISTELDKEVTTRFDYKSAYDYEGVDYSRANYYQSIRLNTYFKQFINESERSEYHQITTNVTVNTRNIKKFKEKYIIPYADDFMNLRLEFLLTNTEVYTDNVRTYSSAPIEFIELEADANYGEGEMVLNKDYTNTFTFDYQIFDGLQAIQYLPTGLFVTGTQFQTFKVFFNVPIELNTGSVSVYTSTNVFVAEIPTGIGLISVTDNILNIDVQGSAIQFPPDDSYYVVATQGLVSGLGIEWDGISDSTTWTFTVAPPDYDPADYDSNDYFTN